MKARSGKARNTRPPARRRKSLVRGRKPILIVQHSEHEHPAALLRALQIQGTPTLWIHPYRGEKMPTVRELGGVVSLGGPMSANDDAKHAWIAKERALLARAVDRGLPILGICLGGQILAQALGGSVEKNPQPEIGWHPLELTAAGKRDPIVGALERTAPKKARASGKTPALVYQWHEDTFSIPKGATLLARSEACPRQAYCVNERVYGFQFHPEADPLLVAEWLATSGTSSELNEIARVQAATKRHFVQTADEQVAHLRTSRTQARASNGGFDSLRLLMSSVMMLDRETKSPRNISETAGDGLALGLIEELRDHQMLVTLEFSAASKIGSLTGKILSVEPILGGQYILFEEQNSWLWPVRVDRIRKVHMAS